MRKEVWKEIDGYNGMYLISNLGNVYSKHVNRNLKHGLTLDGYPYVMLKKDGKQSCNLIHRLVATYFIPNPNNLPIINHKDEDKTNYGIDNLEWCDYSYNNIYNGARKKAAKLISKRVYAYNKNGECVYEYESTQDASRDLKISSGDIVMCCNSNRRTYKNLVWSYMKLSNDEVISIFNNAKSSRKNNSLSKQVNQFDLNGNFICVYPSTREAERQLNISSSLIGKVCRKEIQQTHGYIFRYADDADCEENKNVKLYTVS